jgi:hypothetical protein
MVKWASNCERHKNEIKVARAYLALEARCAALEEGVKKLAPLPVRA